jgi:uncharacterized protein
MLAINRRAFIRSAPLATLMTRAAAADQAPVNLGTASEGGGFVVYALALIDAMRNVDPALEIHTVSTRGTLDNVPMLESGELDIGMVSGEVAHELFEGIGRPASKLRVLTVMYSTPGMFAVRADSRYRSIDDLKGRPVIWNTRKSGLAVQARYMMEGLGLDLDKDFDAIYPDNLTVGPQMVIEGLAAALWGGGLRWPGFVEIANSPRGARFVAPNADEITRIHDKFGFLTPIIVPAGLYPGQYDPIPTLGSWSYILARADFPDAVGYRLAKDLFKIQRTGFLSRQLAESTVKNTVASVSRLDLLQPGVLAYYREADLLK